MRTMKPTRLPALAAIAGLAAACASGGAPEPSDPGLEGQPPRLAVVVVVDQLAQDLLERYADLYTGGLRRLLDDGYAFTDATHDHAATETAVGHTTLSTGVFPSRHGVIANEWSERRGDGWVTTYSVADTLTPILGMSEPEGRSPEHIRHDGFADWLRAARPQAKIANVSRKDRGSIPLAGHVKGDTYWIIPEAMKFVTSTYYRDRYPDWVTRFNQGMPWAYMDSVWNVEVPQAMRERARPDAADYESDRTHTTFPHRLGELRLGDGERARNLWLVETPGPDEAVLKFAEAMVDNLDLGRDDVTDFFSVSFSQTDAIGHRYGPTSLEQLDNLMRVDRRIGELMSYLDEKVGRGRWVMALSADHGVLFEPEFDEGDDLPGHRLATTELRDLLRSANEQAANGDPAGASDRIAAVLRASPLVAQALTESQLRSATAPADSFETLFRNSYFQGRYSGSMARAGVWIRWQEGTLAAQPTGSSHGSPYLYDRHVPLIFYGAGRIAPGHSAARARTVDVAPTLARLVGIPTPSDLDGKPLPVPRR